MGCLAIPGESIAQGLASEVIIQGQVLDSLIFADRIPLRNGSCVTGEIWH